MKFTLFRFADESNGYTIRKKGCSPSKVVSQLSPGRVQSKFTIFRSDIIM